MLVIVLVGITKRLRVSNKCLSETTEVVGDIKCHHSEQRLIYSLVCLYKLCSNFNTAHNLLLVKYKGTILKVGIHTCELGADKSTLTS